MSNQLSDYLGAPEAARFLGVKLRTLYAYVSRGRIQSVASDGKKHLYARSDLARLKARSAARSGHAAVAAGALRWGDPVLESAITEITTSGPRYRGHVAVDLAAAGESFERVACLLWTGELGPLPRATGPCPRRRRLPQDASFVDRLVSRVLDLALTDPHRFDSSDEGELGRAGFLLEQLGLALSRHEPPSPEGSIAESLLQAFERPKSSGARAAIDAALVLSADHELNVSSFAARVVASSGADLYACLLAALAAIGGPLHGGACDRIEALVLESKTLGPSATLRQRARRGEAAPGFGHPLYPDGDPRAVPLLSLARSLGGDGGAVLSLIRAAQGSGYAAPTLDLALVALAHALCLPRGAATALFAMGRIAGWVAHAREQKTAGFLLRPRARYVGP